MHDNLFDHVTDETPQRWDGYLKVDLQLLAMREMEIDIDMEEGSMLLFLKIFERKNISLPNCRLSIKWQNCSLGDVVMLTDLLKKIFF